MHSWLFAIYLRTSPNAIISKAPVFPREVSVPMDGVSRLDYIVQFAANVNIDATVAWIRDNWNK